MPQFSEIGQNLDGVISDFRISGKCLIKENCPNSGTLYDIDMKLESVTKIDKRNTVLSKKFGNDVMLLNCDIIIMLPIYDHFGAIQKPDSGRMVYKTCIFINSNLFFSNLSKTENRTKKSMTQLSSKIKEVLVLKAEFPETAYLHICVYLHTKFQVSSIILTSFRQGVV